MVTVVWVVPTPGPSWYHLLPVKLQQEMATWNVLSTRTDSFQKLTSKNFRFPKSWFNYTNRKEFSPTISNISFWSLGNKILLKLRWYFYLHFDAFVARVSVDCDILQNMKMATETMAGVTLSPAWYGVIGDGHRGVSYFTVYHGLSHIFSLNLHWKITSSIH